MRELQAIGIMVTVYGTRKTVNMLKAGALIGAHKTINVST
jgi:hypothetical protein